MMISLRLKQTILLCISLLFLASCACGNKIATIKSIRKMDKQLGCKDIVMEINETEFYKRNAVDRKFGKLDDILFPFCYPTGFLSAVNAEKSAESRLEYLNEIYELMDCSTKMRFESRQLPPPPTIYQEPQQ